MILPLDWLKELVTVSESAQAVADRLVKLGTETTVLDANRLDLEVTPNRGDLLSARGVAREYAADTKQVLQMPEVRSLDYADTLPDFSLKIEPSAYHRLAAVIVHGVKVESSPDWLKQRIEAAGMNSINSIVDLTNYVMFELGIPIHAFDLNQLPEKSFHVRLSTKGERFTSLKDEPLSLPAGAIVVESGGQVIDLLGIRGGKQGMIEPTTTDLLVWAASLPRPLIRQTVRATGLRTEGAYRHERETDWQLVPAALARVVTLLTQRGGTVTSAVDLTAKPLTAKTIVLDHDRVNQLLGTEYDDAQMVDCLERLGFTIANQSVTVPSWRHFDINRLEDLAEEIARLSDYNQLPRRVIGAARSVKASEYARCEQLKDQLIAAGLTEVYTESLAGRQETLLAGFQEKELAVLANPVNRDFAFCRPAIKPNLIKLLALNSWSDDARLFEIGTVFPAKELEKTHLALAAYGDQRQLFNQWLPSEVIEMIKPDHPLAKRFKLRRPATVAEIPIEQVKIVLKPDWQLPTTRPIYQPVSAFPPAVRDLAIIVDQSVKSEEVISHIKENGPDSLILAELFDQFNSDKFGPTKQSLAFHLIYQSLTGTLNNPTVEQDHQRVITLVKQRFGATIR